MGGRSVCLQFRNGPFEKKKEEEDILSLPTVYKIQSSLTLTILTLTIILTLTVFLLHTKILLHKLFLYNNIFSGRVSD